METTFLRQELFHHAAVDGGRVSGELVHLAMNDDGGVRGAGGAGGEQRAVGILAILLVPLTTKVNNATFTMTTLTNAPRLTCARRRP